MISLRNAKYRCLQLGVTALSVWLLSPEVHLDTWGQFAKNFSLAQSGATIMMDMHDIGWKRMYTNTHAVQEILNIGFALN